MESLDSALALPIGNFFKQRLLSGFRKSEWDEALEAYLVGKEHSLLFAENWLAGLSLNLNETPWEEAERWRDFLFLAILAKGPLRQRLHKECQLLEAKSKWLSFQLVSSLINLAKALLGIQFADAKPQLNESGLIPMQLHGYYSCATVPHFPQQAELGLIWLTLGELTGCGDYFEAALCAAEWIINTVDKELYPFLGMYIREAELSIGNILASNYLLFNFLGKKTGKEKFSFVADRFLFYLRNLDNSRLSSLPGLMPLLENLLKDAFGFPSQEANENKFTLSSEIFDRSCCLIGRRNIFESIACTLHGSGSGLGSYHIDEVYVVAFGPQHLPLGECQGFGIEGGGLYSPVQVSEMRHESNGFVLKGVVRLVDRLDGRHSGVWIETNLQYQPGRLLIETNFLDNDLCLEDLAFSFFIKAKKCFVGLDRTINPCTLDRFVGLPQALKFSSGETTVTIKPLQEIGEMHVIPLAGQDSFWGADFLVAFTLRANKSRYRWSIVHQI